MHSRAGWLLLTLLLLLPLYALGDPAMMKNGYTAWIGENDWLYLRDPAGGLKYMPSAMADLPAMDEENIYCLTASGALWSVRLDGTSSLILNQRADEAAIDAVIPEGRWRYEEGTIYIPALSTRIEHGVLACEWGNTLYYVTQEGNAAAQLNTLPLEGPIPLLTPPALEV